MPGIARINRRIKPGNTITVSLVIEPMVTNNYELPSHADAVLEAACQSATATYQAMSALSASVADTHPDDPRYAAAYAAIEYLRPEWSKQLSDVCRLPARDIEGLQAKSVMINELIGQRDDGVLKSNPALRVAASLVQDVLAWRPA